MEDSQDKTSMFPIEGELPPVLHETTSTSQTSTTELLRITPRNSLAHEAVAEVPRETPYGALRQLANIPRPATPTRRASSAGPSSNRLSGRRTPGGFVRTPSGVQRPASARRPNAVTPHGRAAMRDIELRRAAALTPGKDRRRSGRQQRETPRDPLRQLSRLLAPTTKPLVATPAVPRPSDGKVAFADSDEDGPDPIRPRLSFAVSNVDDEDDSDLLPPRSAGLEDDDYTQRSIELGRRAVSEQPGGRYSRGSFGSIRIDRFRDFNEGGLDGLGSEGFDASYLATNFDDGPNFGDDPSALQENTADLQSVLLDDTLRRASAASGRLSDIRGQVPDEDTENSFVLTLPQRDALARRRSSLARPLRDDSLIQARDESELDIELGDNAADETIDISRTQESRQIDADADASMAETSQLEVDGQLTIRSKPGRSKTKKTVRVSKHGIQYPSLPPSSVKKLAMSFLKSSGNGKMKISKDTMGAIMQASDWFFEQVSDDLGAYASHAGRKTIDESDVITLMKRQRQTNAATSPFVLAQRYLPRELLQDLRMTPPTKYKKGRMRTVQEDDEGDN